MTQQESCSKQRIRSAERPRHVPYTRYGLQSASDVVSVRFYSGNVPRSGESRGSGSHGVRRWFRNELCVLLTDLSKPSGQKCRQETHR